MLEKTELGDQADGECPFAEQVRMQQRVAAAVAEPALRFARRMNLARCEPHSELSSTSYTLANPGEEYLVLQPSDTADPFTVSVTPGTYSVECSA
jgi:hypothetical protein